MRRLVVFAAVAVSTILSTHSAKAVTYRFSGVTSSVDAPISSEFQLGEIVSGTVAIATTPISQAPDTAIYSAFFMSADVGGHYKLTAKGGRLMIENDFQGLQDRVQLEMTVQRGINADDVAGHFLDSFTFNLGYEPSDLTSINLLPQFIVSNPVDSSNLRFDLNDGIKVSFKLNDFSAVPEPGTLLTAVPCVGWLLSRRRHF